MKKNHTETLAEETQRREQELGIWWERQKRLLNIHVKEDYDPNLYYRCTLCNSSLGLEEPLTQHDLGLCFAAVCARVIDLEHRLDEHNL